MSTRRSASRLRAAPSWRWCFSRCALCIAGVAGARLGLLTIPIAIEIAALVALGIFGVRHYASGRTFDRGLKFPFGLFLAPSIWLGWLLEMTLLAPF